MARRHWPGLPHGPSMTPDPPASPSTRSLQGTRPCGLRVLPAIRLTRLRVSPRPEAAQACANLPTGVRTSGTSPGHVMWVTQSLAQVRLPDPPHEWLKLGLGTRPAQCPQRDSRGSDGNLGTQALLLPQQLDNCTPRPVLAIHWLMDIVFPLGAITNKASINICGESSGGCAF